MNYYLVNNELFLDKTSQIVFKAQTFNIYLFQKNLTELI